MSESYVTTNDLQQASAPAPTEAAPPKPVISNEVLCHGTREKIAWVYGAAMAAVVVALIPSAMERSARYNEQTETAALIEAIDQAVVVVDDKMNIRHFSGGAERIFGVKADKVLGKPMLWMVPKAMQKQHLAGSAAWWKSDDTTARVLECTAQDYEGEPIEVRMRYTPVKLDNEKWRIIVQIEPLRPVVEMLFDQSETAKE